MNSRLIAYAGGSTVLLMGLCFGFLALAQGPMSSPSCNGPSCFTPTPTPTPSFTPFASTMPTPALTPSFTPFVSTTPTFAPTPSFTPFISATPTPTPTPSFTPFVSATPTSTPTPTPTPSSLPTVSPSMTPDAYLLCDNTWNPTLAYNPAQAVRNGTVAFTLTLPASNFGRVPNNPSLADSYQYLYTHVSDSSLTITQGQTDGVQYVGSIAMESADAVVLKFDLWCPVTPGSQTYTMVKTYKWKIPGSLVAGDYVEQDPPVTGTISDIRYVSFSLMIDQDVSQEPLGVNVKSQVQLRNLKDNL